MQGRKLYPTPTNDQNISCLDACVGSSPCPYGCGGDRADIYSIPPSSPWNLAEPEADSHSGSGSRPISTLLIVVITVLATSFLLVSYYVIIVKYCKRRNPFRQRRLPTAMTEEFVDENRGPEIDHPIWFINTIGLQPSIINSITVFRYKTGDDLIEGTDCAVCLNEFQDDETLRLLPKCNHAFHVPCIDTWLRSHTNCPVCRAGIVSTPLPNPVAYSSRVNFNSVVPVVDSSDGGSSETPDSINSSSSSSEITTGDGESCENRLSDTNSEDLTETTSTMDKANTELKPGNSDNAIGDEKHEIQSASAVRRYDSVDSSRAAEINGSVECDPSREDVDGNSGGASITQSFRGRNLSR